MKLSEFLKEKRTTAGLSQSKVSKTLGYESSQFISNWERGISRPPIKALSKLGSIYGVHPETILDILVDEASQKVRADLKTKFTDEK